jgi:hypothetical protein
MIGYSYNGSQWQRKTMHGKLYYVPGGDEVGSFYMKEKLDGHGGRFSLETYNPDGWWVVGKDREISKIIGDSWNKLTEEAKVCLPGAWIEG